ncbi:MAG: hypothetical protein AB7L13_04350 [Acidimicrobiia bacterium]
MADPERGDAKIKVDDRRIPPVARRPSAVPRPGEARMLPPTTGHRRKRKRGASDLNWPFAALVTVAVWGLIALLVFRSQSPDKERLSTLPTTAPSATTTAAATTTAPATTTVTTTPPSTAATTAATAVTTAAPTVATTAVTVPATVAPVTTNAPTTTVAPTTTTRIVVAGYTTSVSVRVEIPEALGDVANVDGLTGQSRVFASRPDTLNASTNAGCVVDAGALPGTVVQGQRLTLGVEVFYKEGVADIGSEACGFSISMTAPNCAADCTFSSSRASVRINP